MAALNGVLRATFILDQSNKPVLVTEENAHLLTPGKPIIRKIPGLTTGIDNNFHEVEEYQEAAVKAGWEIVSTHEDHFASEKERIDYNALAPEKDQLGSAYVNKAPFMVMELRKPPQPKKPRQK